VGCPVIASLGGATVLVIITEPTVSGIHDLERVVDLASNFKVPGMVCINKYDLNPEMTESIEQLAIRRNITVLGKISFDPVFTRSMVHGKNVLEFDEQTEVREQITAIWKKIMSSPSMNPLGIVDFKTTIQ
jgi:MinD superfamily P-loop ATPase